MITLPKLLLLFLVAFAAWYAVRWIDRPPPRVTRRREGGSAAVEDLTACRVCGAYVAASAHGCGKPSCPLPR